MIKKKLWAPLLRQQGFTEEVVQAIYESFDRDSIEDEQDFSDRFTEFVAVVNHIVEKKNRKIKELERDVLDRQPESNQSSSRLLPFAIGMAIGVPLV